MFLAKKHKKEQLMGRNAIAYKMIKKKNLQLKEVQDDLFSEVSSMTKGYYVVTFGLYGTL